MTFEASPALVGTVAFLVGVVVVVGSVEVFVETVAEAALGVGVSGFFLTVLLAGTDLENAVLGLAAVLDRLPDLALGTVFGEAMFVLGAAVGLAGVLTPFETDVPRAYLALMLGSPALLVALSIDGTLTRLDGLALTLAYLPLVAVVYRRERSADTRYLGAESPEAMLDDDDFDVDLDLDFAEGFEPERLRRFRERNEGTFALGAAVLSVAGMTVGSELAVSGARTLLSVLGVGGLAFGATVVSFVASLEELFLTVEPVRQNRPHLGVGNVVGSTLFFVTANAGVIALVSPIDTGGTVLTVHWPFLLAVLAVVGGVLYRGRVGRPAGVLLLGTYVAYVGVVLAGDLLA